MKTQIVLYLWILFMCVVCGGTAEASSYYFRTLDTKSGLSHCTVNAIVQDREGFMWFGTKDGLNKYDGVSFRVFQKENSTLGNNFITVLHEDSDGNIWVGTDAGVYIYYPEKENFTLFNAKIGSSEDTIGQAVTWIDSDRHGNVWIASEGRGLAFYDKKKNRLEAYIRPDEGLTNITHFLFDDKGLWIATHEGNLYYSTDCAHIEPFKDAEGREPFKGKIIDYLLKGLHNCMYVTTTEGLWQINLATSKTRKLLDGYVRCACWRSDTELWAGSEQGIYVYDLEKDSFTHLIASVSNDPYALSDNAVYALLKDREGGMWIGSYFGGVNYYPYPYTYFEKYYPRDGMLYMGRRVREFCAGIDGDIWFGTEDKGLFRFEPDKGLVVPFRHPALYHNIHGLCLDGDYLWVGTFSGGLNCINLRTYQLKHYGKGNKAGDLNDNNVFAICKTSTGELWVGTPSGLLRYNRAEDNFERIKGMEYVFIYNMLEDSFGKLWIATYTQGVYCYDMRHRAWKHYGHQPGDTASLPYNKVISIFEDSKKRLWFMTQGEGICRYRPDTDDFVHYGMADGFPSNIIYKMQEDTKGLLWLTTSNGLVSFNPETEAKHIYTIANGLLDNQFNYQSGYRDATGKLYFGCINGFIAFNPAEFVENRQVSPLVLSDFFLFNERLPIGVEGSPLVKSITMQHALELENDQNSFSLRAAVLSYQAPLSNTILYKLEGFDKEWSALNRLNSRISYSNLPSGSYVLRVRGANSDGVWNPDEKTLAIRVYPPFYLSWKAYLLYVVLSVGFVVWIVCYFRKRTMRKHLQAMEKLEYEKERELYASKIDFFTNVAHEIRTPLTLIKNPLENVLASHHVDEEIKDDLEIMDLNTNRLLDLVNQLLDFRKTETKGFQLNFMEYDIPELLRSIYIRFTPVAREKGLKFTVETGESFRASVDKEGFTKIISNLFTNALKYAATYVSATLKKDEEAGTLVFSIVNDGKVVPVAMREEIFKPFIQYREGDAYKTPGTGIGLALSRSLTELHGGTLVMGDDMDCNRFLLTLPLYQEKSLSMQKADAKEQDSDVPVRVESESGQTHFRYTLLVVEDNAEMRKFLQRVLSGFYKVLVASNGVEALEVLRTSVVNLIVSDIMMPEMDGLELCNRVKSDLEFSHIPVVLLTAKTSLQSKMDGLNAGADAYVEKPFSMEYLKLSISSLLKSREQLQAAFVRTPFAPTNSVTISKADEDFLKKLNGIVQENIQNPDFNLENLADKMYMSYSTLNRKIKGILGVTPNDYIRLERLKKAAQLLKEGTCKVNEVCYRVGFNSPSYFAKCFQKQFGVLPKDFS